MLVFLVIVDRLVQAVCKEKKELGFNQLEPIRPTIGAGVKVGH